MMLTHQAAVEVFDPLHLVAIITAICGAIIALSTVVGIAIKAIQKAKSPQEIQNKRLDRLENDMEEVKEKLDDRKEELEQVNQGSKATQKALLALLTHAIDGDDSSGELKRARARLDEYLVDK